MINIVRVAHNRFIILDAIRELTFQVDGSVVEATICWGADDSEKIYGDEARRLISAMEWHAIRAQHQAQIEQEIHRINDTAEPA